MADYVIFTRLERRRMARIVMFLLELPAVGVNVGDGLHVTIAPPPPVVCPKMVLGWTTRHVDWVKHPANTGADTDRFAIRITPELQAAWLARRDLLSGADRTWCQGKIALRAPLTADWERSVPLPVGGSVSMLVEDEDVEPEP